MDPVDAQPSTPGPSIHMDEVDCPECDGHGWYSGTESGHGCDGTERSCEQNCPVPIQVQVECEMCNGRGKVIAA